MARFTLYGSPHSLPTYKVALMLRLSQQPFSFRYVSFQKGMHKTPEFKALSRWGQVPVLVGQCDGVPSREPGQPVDAHRLGHQERGHHQDQQGLGHLERQLRTTHDGNVSMC